MEKPPSAQPEDVCAARNTKWEGWGEKRLEKGRVPWLEKKKFILQKLAIIRRNHTSQCQPESDMEAAVGQVFGCWGAEGKIGCDEDGPILGDGERRTLRWDSLKKPAARSRKKSG